MPPTVVFDVNETLLDLVTRDDLTDDSWVTLGATLDTGADTLTKTGETGAEYALAE